MSERNVWKPYIPPDFDISKIQKFIKRDRNIQIRMMLPFSLCCNNCGECMYRWKILNTKREDIKDEDYMGIKKIRFYIKCTACSAEITFKTDPKNSDYECESGASRNFEFDATIDKKANQREGEDNYDTMKALENRTMDNKVEIDILDETVFSLSAEEVETLQAIRQQPSTSMIPPPIVFKRKRKADELATTPSFSSSGAKPATISSTTTETKQSTAPETITTTKTVTAGTEIGVLGLLADYRDDDEEEEG